MAHITSSSTESDTLEHCIRSRHSIRFYKPDPVDESLLRHCLKLAQLVPSNSHMQNWRLALASGAARDRIVHELRTTAGAGTAPAIPPLPEGFQQFRSQFGHHLYGAEGYGIAREDREGMMAARLRNYEFFGAPVIGVITMDRRLETVDAMSVGFFIQTFMLALTEQGLGTCLEVSVTGYPDILRKGFELPEDQMVLCGIAIGYPADHKVNQLHVEREPLEKEVRLLTE